MSTTLKAFFDKFKEETIFYLFEDKEIENIIPYLESAHYPAKSIVFNEGDSGDFISFVMSGKLEVKKQTEFKGKQIIVALLSTGSFVGELSLFDEQKRSATVVAIEDSELIILKRELLGDFMQKYPEAGIKLLKGVIRILSIRLRMATERLTTIF